jgi:hypothetical protein
MTVTDDYGHQVMAIHHMTNGPIGTKLGRNDHWMVPYNVYGFLFFIRRTQETPKGVKKGVSIYMGIDYLRNKSWKPECVLSFMTIWVR